MRGMPDYNSMTALGTNKVMKASSTSMRTFLAFDYGLKRIGVAVGQELTGTATALTVVKATDGKPDWDAITRLIEQWKPDELVIGLPMNMDGTFHELSYMAQRFGNQLNGRYNLRANFIDERLSSLEAEQQIKNQQQILKYKAARIKGRKGQPQDIDKIAAKVILESWLDQQKIGAQKDEVTR